LDILDKWEQEKEHEFEEFQKTEEYKEGAKAYEEFDQDNKVEISLR